MTNNTFKGLFKFSIYVGLKLQLTSAPMSTIGILGYIYIYMGILAGSEAPEMADCRGPGNG